MSVSLLHNGIYVPVLPCYQRPEAMMQVWPRSVLRGWEIGEVYSCEVRKLVLEITFSPEVRDSFFKTGKIDDFIVRVNDLDHEWMLIKKSSESVSLLDLRDRYNMALHVPTMAMEGWEKHPGIVKIGSNPG
jgi:hypothetical protein